MTDNNNNYILITPVKNEEDNLSGLIDSIISQEIKPVLWVIVDDCSIDNTPDILKLASEKNSFIQLVTLTSESNYDIGEHYAEVCSIGFQYAIDYCKEKFIAYDYIALSDADMIYPKDYFYRLVKYLNANPEYGIISGKMLVKTKEGKIYAETSTQVGVVFPLGTGRVWRREAFHETSGYLITKSPDAVSNILAYLRGWKLGQIDVIFYQTRDTGSGDGLWRGFFKRGESMYYLGSNPLMVFNSVVELIIINRQKKSLIKSAGLICGYFSSFLLRKKQIEIEEVKEYLGYKRTFNYYILYIKQLLNKG